MKWKFTLTDYSFNPLGDVLVVPEPEGWNGSKFVFQRGVQKETKAQNWHGVFLEYISGELGFVGTGYTMLNDAYDAYGVEADTLILVGIECEDGQGYDTAFTGRVNYGNVKYIKGDNCRIFVGFEEFSCLMTFRNRYDQKVNIESLEGFDGAVLSPYTGIGETATFPEKDIFYMASGGVTEGYTDAQFILVPGFVLGVAVDTFTAPEYVLEVEDYGLFWGDLLATVATGVGLPNIPAIEDGTFQYQPRTGDDCVETDVIASFSLDIDWEVETPADIQGNLKACIYQTQSNGTFISSAFFGSQAIDCNTDVTGNFTASGSGTYTPSADDKFFVGLYFETTGGAGGNTQTNLILTVNSLRATFGLQSLCATSSGKVFLINETLSRTAEIITDDCMRVYSNYYGRTDSEPYDTSTDGCGSNRFITSGALIRGSYLNDGTQPLFNVSFKDLFDGLNPIDCIGIGIEDDPQRAAGFKRIRIETVDYFYQDVLIAECLNVKEITISVDEKKIYSNIEGGYKNWEPSVGGNLDDFHSPRTYRTEQQAITNNLNIQSEFIASNYAWELTRRQGATTEAWEYDDNIFVACYARNAYGQIDVDDDFFPNAGANNLGLFYFNQRITPVRNLLHWFKVIGATWANQFLSTLKGLKFTSGEGNYISQWRKTVNDDCLLEVQSVLLAENQDVDKSDFKDYEEAKPLWFPEVLEFDYPMSYDQFRTIKLAPYGKVRVTQGADEYFGFIDTITYDPNEGMAKWKLIRKYEDSY